MSGKGYSGALLTSFVESPHWLADEMVGRLARYLRFVGGDTEYARGLSDEEILRRAKAEDRVILTRDRRLAERAERVVLLTSPHLAEQWRQVRVAFPGLPSEFRFERCTECNGRLEKVTPLARGETVAGVPLDRVQRGLPLYRCAGCGHYYWEGSHTAQIRARLASWAEAKSP